ncbi:MAG: transcriptional regulator PpsR [Parvularculaceae bacterium]|nr:transcriptional regulator PpsR [Parvularculaceae bacterium]
MNVATNREKMVPFKSPKRFLGDIDANLAARVIASAADIALIVDNGVIKDLAVGNEELTREGCDTWRGRKWIETVTADSRAKIEDLLNSDTTKPAQWRQVNHPTAHGADIPIKYTTVRFSNDDRIVAIGRDLRNSAALQQRLLETQQEMDRDYSKLREVESRYQSLFRAISEPVLIVAADTLQVEEANPACAQAMGTSVDLLRGAALTSLFDKTAQRAIDAAAAKALTAGRAETADIALKSGRKTTVIVSAFRQENTTRLIVRFAEASTALAPVRTESMGVIEHLPDGLIVAGSDFRIIATNRAFLDLAHLSSEQQALGVHMVQFLGRSATDLNVLIANVKTHGFARNFATVLRDRHGKTEDVEVSGVSAPRGDQIVYGFSIRGIARRLKAGALLGAELPNSVDRLTALVGRVSLKEIVRESTDVMEKLCIEAALEITGDNRASAAEMLGLSRQGLYSKLRRFGFPEKE